MQTSDESAHALTVTSTAWARIHGYARQVRIVQIARSRCWVAWRTSTGAHRVSQIHIGELATTTPPGAPVSQVAPPALSIGLTTLDAELRRRRLRSEQLARRKAERAAQRAS